MKNKNYKKKKFTRRKIKIRLVDPNIPDSYICEIFDSSIENDDDSVFDDSITKKVTEKKESEGPKHRNCFEILMSKESRQSFSINSARENEKIPEESKLLKVTEDEDTIRERKIIRQKQNEMLIKLANEKRKNKYDYDSSDDESLFQIRSEWNSCNGDSDLNNKIEAVKEEDVEILSDVPVVLNSPKSNFSSKKKSLNILNYFTKVDTIPNGSHFQKSKYKKIENIQKNVINTSAPKNPVTNIKFNGVNKENVKLAPLFQKKEKKVFDLAAQKARHNFLFNGPPSNKKQESFKSEIIWNFPICPHVQQRNGESFWSPRDISLPLLKSKSEKDEDIEFSKKFSISITSPKPVINSLIANKINYQHLKCKYSSLESIVDGLKEKKDKFAKVFKELASKKYNDEIGYEAFNILWTEKYKPKSNEILGNQMVVSKLKNWLQSWKNFDEELKTLIKSKSQRKSKNNEDSNDDDDDFFQSDEENCGLKTPGNVCILSGPNGCGKTALIFALANELEFSVLEVNASSKRTGKKVLTDLQEATQSHKVQRVNLFKTETPLVNNKKKKGKRKRKTNNSVSVAKIGQANDFKISLILIEDADIVFEEHDEGFISAIASLVQTSKRPLVFLSNDPDCGYLEAFKNEQSLILEMERPDIYKSCAVLEVVSNLEGGCFGTEALKPLIRRNSFDLRKSFLELQFWAEPDSCTLISSQPFNLGQFWWGSTQFLFGQDISHVVLSQKRKRKRINSLFDESENEETVAKKCKLVPEDLVSSKKPAAISKKLDPKMISYFKFLDLVSIVDGFRVPEKCELTLGFEFQPKDSIFLDENMEEVSWLTSNLSERISEELARLSSKMFASNCKEMQGNDESIKLAYPSWEEIRWRKCRDKASDELSVLVPPYNGRDKRNVHLDYLPLIRNICRIEKSRSFANTKRKNRFHHYLNNFGVELTEDNLQINCEVFNL